MAVFCAGVHSVSAKGREKPQITPKELAPKRKPQWSGQSFDSESTVNVAESSSMSNQG